MVHGHVSFSKFHDFVVVLFIWFSIVFYFFSDHSVKYRQIVELPNQPKLIRFIEPNTSLVAFADNTILLTDMSSQYTVEPTLYEGHDCTIRDMQFIHEHFFGSLDVKGTIKIWSLKETEIQRRRHSRGKDASIQVGARQKFSSTSTCARKTNPGQLMQTMDLNVRCFIVHHRKSADEMHIFAATETGKILVCEWNKVKAIFEIRPSLSFDTKVECIEKLILIPNLTHMMTINHRGVSDFFNLMDHSKTSRTSRLEFPAQAPINVHALSPDVVRRQRATLNGLQTIAVVFFDCVFQITISHVGQVLLCDMVEAYRPTDEQNFITCSIITDDCKYLMLGTKKGIIVFDPMLKRVMLRSNVSDSITCMDVCSLDDKNYRYTLISATKKGGAVINFQGIRIENHVVEWATNRIGSPLNGVNIGNHGTINERLIGGKSFDIIREDGDIYTLAAADSKSMVYSINSSDSFNAREVLCKADDTITAVSIGAKKKFYGCGNGTVYEFTNQQPLSQLNGSIEYLKYYERFDILIAGTRNYKRVFVSQKEIGFESEQMLATFTFLGRFIVFVNTDCSFDVCVAINNHN